VERISPSNAKEKKVQSSPLALNCAAVGAKFTQEGSDGKSGTQRGESPTPTSFRSTPWRRSTLAPVVDLHKFLEPVRPQREFVPVRGTPSSPFLALGREHDLLECVKRDAISVP